MSTFKIRSKFLQNERINFKNKESLKLVIHKSQKKLIIEAQSYSQARLSLHFDYPQSINLCTYNKVVALWVSHNKGVVPLKGHQAKSGVPGEKQKQQKLLVNLSTVQKCSMCAQS